MAKISKIKESVETYLRAEERFRERSNKDKGIVNLLLRKYGALQLLVRRNEIDQPMLVKMIQDASSMDRAWRKCLEDDETLRGTDYGDKDRLEDEVQMDLGYTPGYESDIKKLETL